MSFLDLTLAYFTCNIARINYDVLVHGVKWLVWNDSDRQTPADGTDSAITVKSAFESVLQWVNDLERHRKRLYLIGATSFPAELVLYRRKLVRLWPNLSRRLATLRSVVGTWRPALFLLPVRLPTCQFDSMSLEQKWSSSMQNAASQPYTTPRWLMPNLSHDAHQ